MPSAATQEWLDKADEDERAVAVISAAGGPWGIAAYHVQQAAEKYLKAALVESGVPPPKSHDLTQLLSLYPGAPPGQSVETAAAMTSAYAWLTRYPGGPAILESDLAVAAKYLVTVKNWVLSTL